MRQQTRRFLKLYDFINKLAVHSPHATELQFGSSAVESPFAIIIPRSTVAWISDPWKDWSYGSKNLFERVGWALQPCKVMSLGIEEPVGNISAVCHPVQLYLVPPTYWSRRSLD